MTGRTEDARPVSEAVRAVVAPAISRVTTHCQCNGMRADPPARPFAIPSGRETGVQHHSIVLYNTTKWKQNKMSLVNGTIGLERGANFNTRGSNITVSYDKVETEQDF